MSNTIKVRRGVTANLPTLEAGELAWTTDTYALYVGDGAANHRLGDVVGPASVTTLHIAQFDGVTGKLLKDGGVLGTMAAQATGSYTPNTTYDAQTLLVALVDNTPIALNLSEQTVLGRLTGGDITALTASNVRTLLGITAAGAALLDDANAAAQIATLGLDADIATLSLPASTTISAAGAALIDDANAAAQLVTIGALPIAGGTLTGTLVMDNMDVTLVKLLTLHGEIDDGNSGAADVIDWNAGAAHKSTLTGNVTLAFTGYGPDVATGGTPSASSSAGSPDYIAANAFDDSTATSWASATVPVQWIRYQLGTAKTILAYSINTYSNGQTCPRDWTFEGSNNGTNWTTLATVTNGFAVGDTNTLRYFPVTTPGSYTYYQLNISAMVNNAVVNIFIREIQLFDAGVTDPLAPCFLTLKLVQDATGGRTVTWPATVKGTPAINLAANATSNVLFYWDGTNYWTLNGKQFVSATDKVLGRSTAGAGEVEEIACTAAGRAILDDANAAAQLTTLGAMSDWVAAPAAANSAGTAGQKAYANGYFYVCIAASTWQRVAIATWA
jgi:hypothetical protein